MSMTEDAALATAVAESGIMRTLNRCAHAVDFHLVDEWVDCYTETGAYEIRRQAEAPRVIQGRQALREYASADAPDDETISAERHLLLMPRIEVTGERATVDSYFFLCYADGGVPVLGSMGRYRDILVRCDDGRWRLQRRTFTGDAKRPRS